MKRRVDPFEVGEWYHCYNRGIDERTTFHDTGDYYRFIELLYLANDTLPLRRSGVGARTPNELFKIPRGEKLVSIGAFCLMPNHFHIALRETVPGGISSFMRKVGTAYTMYFNARHERIGNLFLKPFQSTHVPRDRYLQSLMSYIHCTPAALYEKEWKTGHVVDPQFLEERVASYPYSSIGAYTDMHALTRPILEPEVLSTIRTLPIQRMLREVRRYCTDFNIP